MSAGDALPAVDGDYLVRVLLELLATPSPSGFTEAAVELVARELESFGQASRRTPKGALLWTLPGADPALPARALAAHVDTLGAMVKELKDNGRLKLTNIGGYDWATVEGAECRLHTASGAEYSGTVVNVKQSSHVFGRELRDLKRDAATLELRLDAPVRDADELRALGVEVGDFVSFDANARLTDHGFVKGRHLDNKAAVAVCLAASRALHEAGRQPPGDVHVFISTYEEVGHGAAAGIPPEVTELLCLDMAAVGPGQASSEHHPTLCVKDASGPYDHRMGLHLRELAARHRIDLKVDVYPYYASDASAAWRAGGAFRAALIGPGVDASHAYERTHRDALDATAALTLAYLLEPPG